MSNIKIEKTLRLIGEKRDHFSHYLSEDNPFDRSHAHTVISVLDILDEVLVSLASDLDERPTPTSSRGV